MRFRHQLHVTQSEAEALYVMDVPGMHAEVFFEYAMLIFSGNADTVIGDGDANTCVHVARAHSNIGTFRGVFYSIIQNIVDDVCQMDDVRVDRRGLSVELT